MIWNSKGYHCSICHFVLDPGDRSARPLSEEIAQKGHKTEWKLIRQVLCRAALISFFPHRGPGEAPGLRMEKPRQDEKGSGSKA